MIKGPKVYLFYSILCVLLFAVGYYKIGIEHTRNEWWVPFILLVPAVVFFVCYLVKRK